MSSGSFLRAGIAGGTPQAAVYSERIRFAKDSGEQVMQVLAADRRPRRAGKSAAVRCKVQNPEMAASPPAPLSARPSHGQMRMAVVTKKSG